MPMLVNGLPVHVLLVHLVVVLVPVAALLLVGQAWSLPVRRWAGPLGPLLCFGALLLVPLTTSSGQWLQDRLRPAPLIEKHADLGDSLLPWVVGMLVLSLVVFVLGRRMPEAEQPVVLPPTAGVARLQVVVAVLATAVALGAVVQVFRIGESGAQAVWQGSVAEQ